MDSMVKVRPNVALIVETAAVYGREILRGIARYQRAHGGWSVFLDEQGLRPPLPLWLLDQSCDGVICRSTTPEIAATLRETGLPAVDVNDRYGFLGIPRVSSDMAAIGQLAAEHLLERGFRHIAFCGFSGEAWSSQRLAGVQDAVRGAGQFCGAFESAQESLSEDIWQERTRIGAWLQALPRPLGIVACNDVRAYHVLDTCRMLGIAVPEEVAVVGVDNAETICELCHPPLSSVLPNAERVGFEAALLLDHLMAGQPPQSSNLLIAPKEVITRNSSDVLAVDDPTIASALHFVRERACSGITVDDILAHAHISRSTLERGFRHFLGHSPQAEIRQVRLKRIKHLLAETDWTLAQIAHATGFESPDYMMVHFKRVTGQTPSQWRLAHQTPHL